MKGAVAPLLINEASKDERVKDHPGLKLYGIESYVAVPLNRRDGSYFGTLCALDPAPSQLGEEAFDIFNLLSDLIAFELEAEEEKQAREAEIGALNDIISIAAHDLRQPLSSMQGWAQLTARRAKREGVSEELSQNIDRIVTDTRRMAMLTDSLLDVGRIEAGSFKLERAKLDLVTLVHQIIEDVKANSPAHTFNLSAPEALLVEGDAVRLAQVVRNLLDNAVKYSPQARGPIEVRISLAPGQQALFEVQDCGIGVAEGDLPRLFERQYRTDEAVASGISGSGLGLYISKTIIEAHGGRIWAELTPDGGLQVCFRLPLLPGMADPLIA